MLNSVSQDVHGWIAAHTAMDALTGVPGGLPDTDTTAARLFELEAAIVDALAPDDTVMNWKLAMLGRAVSNGWHAEGIARLTRAIDRDAVARDARTGS